MGYLHVLSIVRLIYAIRDVMYLHKLVSTSWICALITCLRKQGPFRSAGTAGRPTAGGQYRALQPSVGRIAEIRDQGHVSGDFRIPLQTEVRRAPLGALAFGLAFAVNLLGWQRLRRRVGACATAPAMRPEGAPFDPGGAAPDNVRHFGP